MIRRADVAAVFALAVVTIIVGSRYLSSYRASGGVPEFYQPMFGPAVMEACGRGFTNPVIGLVPALDAFLENRADRFDCGLLPRDVAIGDLTPMQAVSRYMLMSVAIVWRVLGVSWSAVDWVSSGLFALTTVGSYVAFRLVAGVALSAGLALIWMISPLQLSNLPHLRDYSKAPFFVIGALGLIWMMSGSRRPRPMIAVAAAVGLVIGVGAGFRTDVVVYLLPFFAGIVLCSPDTTNTWRIRALAIAVSASAYALVAWPILRVYSSGQGLWHVALLGLTTTFDEPIGIHRSVYDFGYLYNDAYIEVTTRSYWERAHHAILPGGGSAYAAATGDYYRRLATMFPADFVTRAWAAVLQVLKFPFYPRIMSVVPMGVTRDILVRVYRFRWWVLFPLRGSGLPLLIVTSMLLAIRSWWTAIVLVAFVAFSAGLTSIQFQPRHVFHLEFMTFWLMACALGWLVTVAAQWRRPSARERRWDGAAMRRAIIFAVALVAAVVLPIAGLRAWQAPRVAKWVASQAAADIAPVRLQQDADRDVVRLRVDWLDPASHRPDSFFAQVAVVRLDPRSCPEPVALTFRYTQADPESTYDFTRKMLVDLRDDTSGEVFFPVYVGGAAVFPMPTFQGLEVPAGQRACITSVARLAAPGDIPVLATLVVPRNWRNRHLYQQIDPVEFHPSMITPLVGRAWYRARVLFSRG